MNLVSTQLMQFWAHSRPKHITWGPTNVYCLSEFYKKIENIPKIAFSPCLSNSPFNLKIKIILYNTRNANTWLRWHEWSQEIRHFGFLSLEWMKFSWPPILLILQFICLLLKLPPRNATNSWSYESFGNDRASIGHSKMVLQYRLP